jgi:H/ACA ribonucleoprotein complex subunit 4
MNKGILLLDKPEELTSMQCVEIAKQLLKAGKAGHSGTLDPRVTGLMLIAFNEATKAMPVLLGLDKSYEGVMRIHGDFSEKELVSVARKFTGNIIQTPPKKSAVVRKPRKRQVLSLEILSVKERDVGFRVATQAGTYIRTLCHDIGESLGTGAHMARLRRTGIGPFSLEEAFTMEQLRSQGGACLFPLETALERIGFPGVEISDEQARKIRTGVPLEKSKLKIPSKERFGLFLKGELLSLARLEDGRIKPERVFN